MQLVYASRTGNVEKLISRLGISALKIESGEEKVSGDYVLVTYTDGAGILPPTVEKFIEENKGGLKAAEVSGNSQRHPDTFCKVADILADKYGCDVIARFETDGDASVEEAIKKALA